MADKKIQYSSQVCRECSPTHDFFGYDIYLNSFQKALRSAEGVSKKCISCDGPKCDQTNPTNICSGCRSVYYCSRECQRSDWAKHKIQCKLVKNAANEYMGRKTKALMHERKCYSGKCYYCGCFPPVDPIYMECSKQHVICFDCVYDWQDEVDETGTIDWCVKCSCGKGDCIDVQIQSKERGDIYMWYAETHPLCKHYRMKYLNYALREHEKILELIPDHISSSHSTAILLNLSGRREEALKLFDNIDSSIRAMGPDYKWLTRQDIALSRADVLKRLGRYREAMAIYKHQQQVIEKSDDNIDRFKSYLRTTIPYGIMNCMIELGMYQEALDQVEQRIGGGGRRQCGIHKIKALALKGLGNLDGAIETMNRGILYEDPFQSKNKIENYQFYEELCALKRSNTPNSIMQEESTDTVAVVSHVDDVTDEDPVLFYDGMEDSPVFLKLAMSHGKKDRKGRMHLSDDLVKCIRSIDVDVTFDDIDSEDECDFKESNKLGASE